jgi:hypothetical protein
MNRRLLFLSGHLSGLLIGSALVWTYFSNTPAKNPAINAMQRNPVMIPVSYPGIPHVPNTGSRPNGWELRHFNGQPYYIIPVLKEDPGKKI